MTQPNFFRGAKVQPKDERKLTIVEASFVMVTVAKKDGLDFTQFMDYMAKAWSVYGRVAVGKSEVRK